MANLPNKLEPADEAMAAWLGPRLAPAHRAEIRALAGMDAAAALALSLAGSAEAWGYCPRPGEAVFMMGVEPASPLTGMALVWMLGAPDMPRHSRALLRAARWGVTRAFAVTGADALHQFIPAWYGVGLAFAARMGFVPAGDAAGAVHVIHNRRTTWAAR